MEPQKTPRWFFLDLNSYFASVEQQENPYLRNRPVAVVPSMTDATCAIAASYEAKAYGIKTGTKIFEAKKMCPDLQCVLARHDVYVDYHHRILEEVDKYLLVHKVCSIDEFSSKLPNSLTDLDAIRALAEKVKEGIQKNVGEVIKCSIGIGPNSLLAKMATDMQKPDGYVVLHPDDLPTKILNLHLRDIPGIGVNMEVRLNNAGVCTMQDLLSLSPKHARKIWGSVQGERIWYWLHGYDFETPETNRSMIGHSRVLDPTMRSPDETRQMARQLLIKATYRLRRQGLYADRLTLGLRTTDDRKWKREITLSNPAQDPFTFLSFLDQLWGEAMQVMPHRHLKFKKVSTLLTGLKTDKNFTQDLFSLNNEKETQKSEKRTALVSALDTLQKKYKGDVVTLGVSPKTKSGHVGTKIAFSRVPDKEEFWT